MPRRSSKDALLIMLGGYDLRASMSSQTRNREWLTEARFPWGEELEENLDVAISRTTVQQDGYFDDDTHAAHRALFHAQTEELPFLYNNVGAAVGSPTTMVHGARVTNLTEPSQGGQFVKFQAQYQGSGHSTTRGILLKMLAAVVADGSVIIDTGVGETSDLGLWVISQVCQFKLGTATALVITVSEGAADPAGPWVVQTTHTYTDDTVHELAPGDGGHDARSTDGTGTVGRFIKIEWAWTGGAGGGSTAQIAVAGARL